jgi:hypothetical protein
MRPGIPSVISIVVVCFVLSGCDDAEDAVAPSPSAFTNTLDLVRIIPSPLTGFPSHCPSLSPFSVPFILNVTAGTSPLLLSEVRIQPTNPFGRTSPPTIFDSSSLTRRFGSVMIDSFGVRQFPFTHDFSCDMRGSMLDVSVRTTDGVGMNRVSTVQVPVY